ncbi:MAG: carbohydrate porin [Pseudomonadota bacterium]
MKSIRIIKQLQSICLVLLLTVVGSPILADPQDSDLSVEHYRQTPPTLFNQKIHPELKKQDKPKKSDWLKRDQLTGNWGGTRDELAKKGMLFEAVVTAEAFSRISGGDSSEDSTSGLANFDLTATFDTEKLGLWKGGTLFIYYETLIGDGNSINEAMDNPLVPISTLDADHFSQFSAWYYQQMLLDGKLRLKGGKHDANSEFANSDSTGEFINGGISSPANIPYPTFPDPGLGFVAEVTATKWMSILAGIYGADLNGRSNSDGGLFDGDSISLLEFDFSPASAGNYAGNYKIGGWYTTLTTNEIVATSDPSTPGDYSDNYGLYLVVDQPIYVEKGNSSQGMNGFFEYSWAPNNRNQITNYIAFGVIYHGLLPNRGGDDIGLAVGISDISSNLSSDGLTEETAVELFYNYVATPWLTFQPDFQWQINPGGEGPNAVAAGLRTTITF